MNGKFKKSVGIFAALLIAGSASSMINPNRSASIKPNSGSALKNRAAGCAPATALTKLEFNNVSALIEQGGSMWQDRSTGVSSYEVPKVENAVGPSALYAGALWLGGKDFNDQLKVAALTFRTGNDFWPGPLLTDGTAEVDAATCLKFDKFYVVNRQEVATFVAYNECLATPGCDPNENFPGYTVPASITNWPGNNFDAGFDPILAPFKDVDNDYVYDPTPDGSADYPWYDLKKELTCGADRTVVLYGDQTYWWVFNDKGNIHTETGADPIGMEIRAQAFAFSTSDEVNNMTFYNYELRNRGTQTIYNTYFGQWADADLGCSNDDFVGCDVQRGLGYAYNGDPVDEACTGSTGYGANPPAIGIDFFEGPYQDGDNLDNPLTTNISDALDSLGIPYKGIGIGYGDNVVDNERFGMRKFLYYFRDDVTPLPAQGEPSNANDFYRYLQGIWLDGTPFYYGGTAHQSSAGAIANGLVETDYMFPGDSDPLLWGTEGISIATVPWDEISEGNQPADRRFMQSAGPFTLTPGQKNNITVGVVYARAVSGNSFESVELLKLADDKAQALFDNCFKILDGPHAPDLTLQELDKEIILYVSNPANSNNANEDYQEKDPFIVLPSSVATGLSQAEVDSLSSYRFQGYKIYQLKDETVSSADLSDPDKARLVGQCDVKDSVTRLINFTKDEDLGYDVPVEMVNGSDLGVKHSFRFQDDAFTQARLINHKTYYYMAISYAYNNYKKFDPTDATALDGQKKPYIESRLAATGSIKAYSAIPHIPVPEAGGTAQHSNYGDGPEITRIEGQGNGSIYLDLTSTSEAQIISSYQVAEATYIGGKGPINVKVVDPLAVVPGQFEVRFNAGTTSTTLANSDWTLTNLNTIIVNGTSYAPGTYSVTSNKTIDFGEEKLILDLGISVDIKQVEYLPRTSQELPPLITADIIFSDSSKRWLTGVKDAEGLNGNNWIRCGTQNQTCDAAVYPNVWQDPCIYNDYLGFDDDEYYEGLLEGIVAPYYLSASSNDIDGDSREYPDGAPIAREFNNTRNADQLEKMNSIDIVFTSDKSKWTRCPVLEMSSEALLAEGGGRKQRLRRHLSVDKQGLKSGDAGYNSGEGDFGGTQPYGMGWFPGYAIDLESGERLNMAFGEDSWLAGENGRDMKFNPTNRLFTPLGEVLFGGKHYIYVFQNTHKEIPTAQWMPAYDGGVYIHGKLAYTNYASNTINAGNFIRVFRACRWVMMPMMEQGYTMDDPSQIPAEARIKIRVAKQYEKYSTNFASPAITDTTAATNGWRPLYKFSLDGLDVETNDEVSADSTLDLINIVPNPYYAYSSYEKTKIDTRVKIVNLPEQCTIKIFSVNGQLVRTYTKDSPITSIDWDLKNQAGIPIASGVYIVHVDVPGVGEKIVKWFGALRPPDLQSF